MHRLDPMLLKLIKAMLALMLAAALWLTARRALALPVDLLTLTAASPATPEAPSAASPGRETEGLRPSSPP